mmetsp:Transcript_2421/g.3812  ORF Transcript_2421/g.3812 Transcript_2421/m.3812 type:complete len:303 (-) Transcript_2421:1239-2147(-)
MLLERINKLTWGVALLLSLCYAYIFFQVVRSKGEGSGLLFGFCVAGLPETPDEDVGCANCPYINSHVAAFVIDVFLTAVTAYFWYKDPQKGGFMTNIVYLALGFIILIHGLLHWFLQQTTFDFLPIINCYRPDTSDIEEFGYIIFGTFSFLLSLIILSIGFGVKKWFTWVGSVIFTIAVVNLTEDTGGELILPGLFCIVHPLSCFTGLFTKEPLFNTKVATLFVICTAVGILELSSCNDILRPLVAMSGTILPFTWPWCQQHPTSLIKEKRRSMRINLFSLGANQGAGDVRKVDKGRRQSRK